MANRKSFKDVGKEELPKSPRPKSSPPPQRPTEANFMKRQEIARDLLRHFHLYNCLNSKIVRAIGLYYKVDAHAECKAQGITYDVE
jgi:hypothetical protein